MRIEGKDRLAAARRLGVGTEVVIKGKICVRYSREDVDAVNAEMKRVRSERKDGFAERAREKARAWAEQYVAEGTSPERAWARALAAAMGDDEATDGNPKFCKELRCLMLDEMAQSRSDFAVFPAPPPGGQSDRHGDESGGVQEDEGSSEGQGRAP